MRSMVEGASASRLASAPHAPSTMLRMVPLLRAARGRINKLALAVRSHPSLAHDNDAKIDSLPAMEEGAARRKAHANHCRHAD